MDVCVLIWQVKLPAPTSCLLKLPGCNQKSIYSCWRSLRRWERLSGVCPCWSIDELCLNELSWRHGSMTGVLQKARLCAMTTKRGPRLCLGAGTAERACLDSECHRVLYSHLECPVSSPVWAVLSVRMVMISHGNLTGEVFADAAPSLVSLHVLPLKQDAFRLSEKQHEGINYVL